jgi:hypothetical protein
LLILASAAQAWAAEPVTSAWIKGPAGTGDLAKVLPDVRSVEVTGDAVIVRSAGISLRYLGPLESAPMPSESVRQFAFRIPRHPEPQTGLHARLPNEIAGVFLNGMPIYNQFEALSFNGANIWHYDRIAYAARPDPTHPPATGLLEELVARGGRGPLIGFALDGYPVYGPWEGISSSYRHRAITKRHTLPDATELTPAQYGPDVSADIPMGTFVEDYEYVPAEGQLDQFNGRFTVTPEYPAGTYAYFLSADRNGHLAWPNLMGPRLFGKLSVPSGTYTTINTQRLELSADRPVLKAGDPVHLRLIARTRTGEAIRHFEYVHEKPIHLLIASADLAEFDHIHPELQPDDSYEVPWTFPHGGAYRLWADYSLPGEAPRVERFDVTVEGPAPPAKPLLPSSLHSDAVDLITTQTLRAGEDISITVRFNGSVDTLEPYLGAWAHVVVVREDSGSFAHAHPLEAATAAAGTTHTHAPLGPAPQQISIVANFPSAGLYKIWVQFQQSGKVITVPFVVRAEAGITVPTSNTVVPPHAIRIRVTSHGYEPAKLDIPADQAIEIAFTRDSSANCGAEVIFPAPGIRKALPLGQTVVVKLPAQPAGEISFSCGMGMYRGMMIAR